MAVYVVIPPCMAKRHKDDGQTSVENPSSLKFPFKRRPGSPYARVLRGRWKRATAVHSSKWLNSRPWSPTVKEWSKCWDHDPTKIHWTSKHDLVQLGVASEIYKAVRYQLTVFKPQKGPLEAAMYVGCPEEKLDEDETNYDRLPPNVGLKWFQYLYINRTSPFQTLGQTFGLFFFQY